MPTLKGTKRRGDISLTSRSGVSVVEETFEYLVEADYIGQPLLEVARAAGMPREGVSTSSGGLAVCRSLSGKARPNAMLMHDFVANFSSEVEEGTQDPGGSDPTAWVPTYETRMERLTEPATKDRSGTAIANSAGQAFSTGIMLARFIPVWEFPQFEAASVTDEVIIDRNETTNDGIFRGRAANTLLCTVVSSTLGFFYGQRRRLTVYSLKYNKEGWKHKRLDIGTVYKSGSDLIAYTDDAGNVIAGGLNGSGAKVTGGSAPSILEFDQYEEIDFYSFLRT